MSNPVCPTEVLWSTESSGQLWNTCLWDLHTGSVEHTFKGGISAPNSLCFIKDDYLMSVEHGKPLLHYWTISKKDGKQTRIVLPGKVEALAVTRDGYYCVAAIAEKVHIWQVNSGKLLAILSAHYQTIRCIRIDSQGSYLLTAGDDAIIHCWSLSSVVDQTRSIEAEPMWSSSNHSLPITDLCLACVGHRSRAVSLSMDQSCRMYDVSCGKQIASYVFNVSLTKVCMSACQSALYVGTITGAIHKVSVHTQAPKIEHHIVQENDNKLSQSFTGHSKEVTCLALNLDGSILASGSKDMTVRLWHTPSSQCIRTMPHKGTITNLLITPYPNHVAMENHTPSSCFHHLDRHLHNHVDDSDGYVDMYIQSTGNLMQEEDITFCKTQAAGIATMSAGDRQLFITEGKLPERSTHSPAVDEMRDLLEQNKTKLEQALACNKGLYEFGVKLLTTSGKASSTHS